MGVSQTLIAWKPSWWESRMEVGLLGWLWSLRELTRQVDDRSLATGAQLLTLPGWEKITVPRMLGRSFGNEDIATHQVLGL